MLKNRFLSVFVLAFAAGIAMPFLLGTGMEAVAFLICLCISLPSVGVSLAIFLWRKKGKTVLLYLAFAGVGFCLGAGWLWVRSLPYNDFASYEGKADVVEGIVTESGSSMESSYLELEVERSHISLPAGTKIRFYGNTDNIRIGDLVRAECQYSKVSKPSYRSTSVVLTAGGAVISHTPDDSVLNSFRNVLLDACEDLYTPYDSAGVAQALTMRERSLLPYETSDGYRNAGVAHLLAISGLHLSILIALLRRILLALRLRKITRECIALGIILLYCILTGFSPSIVRASVMLGFVLLGELFLDETDSLTVLFFALFLLLAANPYALLSVGLQLSFLSCLGILLLEPYVNELQKKIRGNAKAKHKRLRRLAASLSGSFLISCGAVVFTFPVTTVSFGDVSYLAPISNLVFVPLFTPILALILLSVLFYPLLPFLGYGLAFFPGLALQGMNALFSLLQSAHIGSVTMVGTWVAIPVALSALAMISMLVLPKRGIPVFLSCAAGAMASAMVIFWAFPAGEPSVLTVSDTEGYLFLSDGDKAVLADVGEHSGRCPEGLPDALDAYLVTEVSDNALARLRTVLQITDLDTLYLPTADAAGRGYDLSAFTGLAKRYGCKVNEYCYVVETELLLYDVREGRLDTPYGISVLLSDDCTVQAGRTYILLRDLPHPALTEKGAVIYLPSADEGEVPSLDNIHYYTDCITFKNGEVTTP